MLVLAGCRRGDAPTEATLHVFNSDARIEIRGVDATRAQQAIAAAAKRLNERQSEWRAWGQSDVTRINAAFRNGESAEAPSSVLQMIARSQGFAKRSHGLLDPGVGGLVELWGFHTTQYPVMTPAPTLAAVEQWRQSHPSVLDVVVEGNRVSSRNPAVQLDFSAITEGASMLEIEAIFHDQGIPDALIDIGGDIAAIGNGKANWRVAMPDPYGGTLGWVELADGEAFFNSGNYNKFREAREGGRWGHILDPRTGMPAHGGAAAAVLDADPLLADAASTAIMAGGPAHFAELVKSMDVHCALMITEENELLITSAMLARLHLQREPIPLGAPIDAGSRCEQIRSP